MKTKKILRIVIENREQTIAELSAENSKLSAELAQVKYANLIRNRMIETLSYELAMLKAKEVDVPTLNRY